MARLRHLATLLDGAIGIPGTKFRFGLDPLLGLIPGVGDLVGGVLSLFIVLSAARLGVSGSVIGRMMLNIVMDTAVGTVPVLGDIFDAGWKSNLRNVDLIEQHFDAPQRLQRRSTGLMLLVILAGGLALVGAIAGVMALIHLFGKTAG